MNKERITNHLRGVFEALLMAAMVVALPELAWAQAAGGGANIEDTATNIQTYLGTVAPLISGLFWVAGGVLMGAGALKLKEHAENPTQTPMRQGIARLAVGAALLTIPFFAQWVVNTLSAGDAAVAPTMFVAP